jgi:hypothetical protein
MAPKLASNQAIAAQTQGGGCLYVPWLASRFTSDRPLIFFPMRPRQAQNRIISRALYRTPKALLSNDTFSLRGAEAFELLGNAGTDEIVFR